MFEGRAICSVDLSRAVVRHGKKSSVQTKDDSLVMTSSSSEFACLMDDKSCGLTKARDNSFRVRSRKVGY